MEESWLELRKKGIGGSDAAAICGVSPWKTPLDVWREKIGVAPATPDNPAMYWGRALEPAIRQKYTEQTGRAVLLPPGIIYHPDHLFMLGNLDGFTEGGRVVEIKTAGYPSEEWGESGTDEVPLNYLIQCQHYMAITGYQVADMPVLFLGGRDFRIYEIPEDKDLQNMLIEREASFWNLVETRKAPDPVNYRDIVGLYRRSEPRKILATEEIAGTVERLNKIKQDMKGLEILEEACKKEIMAAMMEADTLVDSRGTVLATWKTGNPIRRFDTEALKQTSPETYAMFLKEGDPIRRFLLKEVGKNGK